MHRDQVVFSDNFKGERGDAGLILDGGSDDSLLCIFDKDTSDLKRILYTDEVTINEITGLDVLFEVMGQR